MVHFFATQKQFREWLEKNHSTESELIVGYYKVGSGKPSISWSQSVDQALCFGWIDGIRKTIDNESYCIRFTPRKSTSIWSAINIKKVEDLTQLGQMMPAGKIAFDLRKESKSRLYSHENEHAELPQNFVALFQQNALAWDFFIRQAPSYKKVITYWIMTAKQAKTRQSRLEKTILCSEQKKRVM